MPNFSDRLRAERERLNLSQQALADRCGVTARSQRNYEAGERLPDAAYLSALSATGADVLYILTGQRSAYGLSADEQELLALFRAAPLAVKMAAIGALQGAALGGISQVNRAAGSVMVGVQHGGSARARKG